MMKRKNKFARVVAASLIVASLAIGIFSPVTSGKTLAQSNISFVLVDSGSWIVSGQTSVHDTTHVHNVLGGTLIGYQIVVFVNDASEYELYTRRYSDNVNLRAGSVFGSGWIGVCNYYAVNNSGVYYGLVNSACADNSMLNHGVSLSSNQQNAYNYTNSVAGTPAAPFSFFGINWNNHSGSGVWWLYAIYDGYVPVTPTPTPTVTPTIFYTPSPTLTPTPLNCYPTRTSAGVPAVSPCFSSATPISTTTTLTLPTMVLGARTCGDMVQGVSLGTSGSFNLPRVEVCTTEVTLTDFVLFDIPFSANFLLIPLVLALLGFIFKL